jgi:hypothetical protein
MNDRDEMAALVLVKMAEILKTNAMEIVLTRKEATVLLCWFARELFGEPSEFVEELRNAGILR